MLEESSHMPMTKTRMAICQKRTSALRRFIAFIADASISASDVPGRKSAAEPTLRVVSAIVSSSGGFACAAVAGFHLFAQVVPDRLAIVDEALFVADFRYDARARKI